MSTNRLRLSTCALAVWLAASVAHAFNNPIRTPGQDPSVVYYNGAYYMAQSDGRINVIRSTTLTGLGSGTSVTVWTAPAGAYCCEIWAPELVLINGRFYIYFAADDGNNANHRMYVLDSASPQGPYTFRGKLTATTDRWAIDGSVLQNGSALYFVWSGWEGTVNDQQHLYIAPMSSPLAISGERVRISSPSAAWERVVGNPFINEGPEPLVRNGKAFIIYSANGSWSDEYCFGSLTASATANLLNAASWVKSPGCIFSKRDTAYGPGHGSFTKSPNGLEDWHVYHANTVSGSSWAGRSVRAQRFSWDTAGNPMFGVPAATYHNLVPPGGEPGSTTLPVNVQRSFQTSNFATAYLRHLNGNADTGDITASSDAATKSSASFTIRAGLANAACYSLESVNIPGSFLRHANGRVILSVNDGSQLLRNDATWCARVGLTGSGVSLETLNFPGHYLRHYAGQVWMANGTGTAADPNTSASFAADATWNVVNAWSASATPTATATATATSTPTARSTPTPTTGATPTATTRPRPTPTAGTGCAIGATCEAETALLGGGVVTSTQHAGYTGSGFADYQGNGTGYVEWTVNVPTAGTYNLNIRYGNGGTADRPMSIQVNGTTVVSSLSFPVTGWTTWTVRTQSVSLPAGAVRIRATELPNGPNVDNLSVTATGGGVLVSQGRPALASSEEVAANAAGMAVDGNTATRWSSAFADPQWIRVDLGSSMSVSRVVLSWEAAFGSAYQIQTSPDAITWTTLYSTTTGDGATDDLTGLTGSGRYVRMYGTARATAWGYSLWEFQVYN